MTDDQLEGVIGFLCLDLAALAVLVARSRGAAGQQRRETPVAAATTAPEAPGGSQ